MFRNEALKDKWYLSLTFRYVLHLAGVGAFLSILIIWNASYQQRQIVLREMEQRARLLCDSLAGASSLRYFLGDLKAISFMLAGARGIEDVASLAVLDPEGKTEIHEGPPGERINPSEFAGVKETKVWRDGGSLYAVAPLTIRRLKSEVTDMLLDPAPAKEADSESDTLGYIRINMSLERANQYIRSLVMRSMTATLIIIAFGSGLAFLFFRKDVLRPLRRLAQAMTEARSGHLEVSLGIARRDEIGNLTLSFNEMTANLRKADEQLKSANLDLENRVRERTRDLEQALDELKEAQEKMVRSQKLAAIGQLASGVGHELRNPLGAIGNAIYYIRDALKGTDLSRKDPSLSEFVGLAEGELKSANTIIRDLLDFAHVGQMSLQPADLNDILRSVRIVVDVPANIRYIEDYGPQMPLIMVDPQRMRQVFINLTVNAIQAMPEGGELRVSSRFEDGFSPEHPVVSVTFRDSGIGMSEDTIKKIFEPLFTTKAKGTGLGLAISQGIVESHNGKIIVESFLGKGSTLQVRLSGPQLRTKAAPIAKA